MLPAKVPVSGGEAVEAILFQFFIGYCPKQIVLSIVENLCIVTGKRFYFVQQSPVGNCQNLHVLSILEKPYAETGKRDFIQTELFSLLSKAIHSNWKDILFCVASSCPRFQSVEGKPLSLYFSSFSSATVQNKLF